MGSLKVLLDTGNYQVITTDEIQKAYPDYPATIAQKILDDTEKIAEKLNEGAAEAAEQILGILRNETADSRCMSGDGE